MVLLFSREKELFVKMNKRGHKFDKPKEYVDSVTARA